MSKGTTARNVRIPDDLWDAFLRKAETEGRTGSAVVRELLTKWVHSPKSRR